MTTPYVTPEATATPAAGRGERPTGVAVLAVLNWIAGGLAVVGAIMMVFVGAVVGSVVGGIFGMGAEGGELGMAMAMIGAFFALVFGVIAAVAGFGLWRGESWAWVLELVLAGLVVLGQLGDLARGSFDGVLSLALAGFIIWYMLQPGVKRWFGRA